MPRRRIRKSNRLDKKGDYDRDQKSVGNTNTLAGPGPNIPARKKTPTRSEDDRAKDEQRGISRRVGRTEKLSLSGTHRHQGNLRAGAPKEKKAGLVKTRTQRMEKQIKEPIIDQTPAKKIAAFSNSATKSGSAQGRSEGNGEG